MKARVFVARLLRRLATRLAGRVTPGPNDLVLDRKEAEIVDRLVDALKGCRAVGAMKLISAALRVGFDEPAGTYRVVRTDPKTGELTWVGADGVAKSTADLAAEVAAEFDSLRKAIPHRQPDPDGMN